MFPSSSQSHPRGRSAFALALGLMVIAGCGGGGGPDRLYRVSGHVTSHGKALPKGTVTFSPDGGAGRIASGDIGPDGSYALTTVSSFDGAMPGKYRVTIVSDELDLSKLPGGVKPGVALTQEQFQRAPRRSLIASKYALPETSGLSAVVEARSSTANFDLP